MKKKMIVIILDAAFTGVFLAGCSKAAAPGPATASMPAYASVPAFSQTPSPTIPSLYSRISWRNEIVSAALADNLLGDPAERNYSIYLPPSYQTGEKRYPVVYILQGYTGGVDFGDVARRMDQLVASHDSQEAILVLIDGVTTLLGSWYLNSPTIGDYETFIAEEVVSKIDSAYRTLPTRDGRGITGCNMGGFGSLHMALLRPDVFGVAAPMSGPYDWERWTLSLWEAGRPGMPYVPKTLWNFHNKPREVQVLISLASATASNPEKPPFYLDMPFQQVDNELQAVPEVFQRINAHDPVSDLRRYLEQPVRLRGLMMYQDSDSGGTDRSTAEGAIAFHDELTRMGVEHTFLQVEASFCGGDWGPILEFLSDHLAH